MTAIDVEAQLVIDPILRYRQKRVYKMGDGDPGHRELCLEKKDR